jgi:hypothetical protein
MCTHYILYDHMYIYVYIYVYVYICCISQHTSPSAMLIMLNIAFLKNLITDGRTGACVYVQQYYDNNSSINNAI